MKRLTGKLTRQDILDAGGVIFFTNSALETRMILDVLRFEMGFTLANDIVEGQRIADLGGEILAYRDGRIWTGWLLKNFGNAQSVGTIQNLIPDYVDPVTEQFNKLAERFGKLEERIEALEQKSGRSIKTASILSQPGDAP